MAGALIRSVFRYGFILLVFFSVVSCGSQKYPSGSELLKFDQETWKERKFDVENNLTTRQMMVKDIIENIIPRKTKNHVEELLGSPIKKNERFIYFLGQQRDSYFPIDNEWLYIEYNSDGVVKYSYIYNT